MSLSPVLILAALSTAVPAVPDAQAVVGRVLEGRSGQPVTNVPVLLVDADFRTVSSTRSDDRGRYEIRPGRTGTFWIVVDGAGFASHLSAPIPLRGTELFDHPIRLSRVRLNPRGATVEPTMVLRAVDVAGACGPRFDPTRHGIAVGQVSDPATGMTLTDMWISARSVRPWPDPGSDREARSGVDGLYVFCDLPPDQPVRLRASGAGIQGPEATVRVAAGDVRRVDLELPLSVPGTDGKVLGRVTDASNGRGIDAAEIRLRATGQWLLTDRNGHFALDSVPAGLHILEIHRIGYATREVAFRVEAGGAHGVRVPLSTEAVPLDPVEVTVRSPRWAREMRQLQERMLVATGIFFTREELERAGGRRLGDLVGGVPRMEWRGAAPSLGVGPRRCEPALVVDRVPRRDDLPWSTLRADDLEAVEVYRGPHQAPGRYVPDAECGSVLVWTRTGWS